MISILLILFGVKQINKQCYDILEEPCDFLNQYNCTGNTYTQHLMNYQAGVNNEEKEHADFINQFNTT